MFVETMRPAPGVAMVRLARPERLNALSMAVVDGLADALNTVRDDPQVEAVVLTGAGRAFCAGGDVKEMRLNREKTLDERRHDLVRIQAIPRLIQEMPQLVVAAVNGPAYGAGFGLALACDLVLAAEAATFRTVFLAQGLASDFGLSFQLTRLAGPAAARRLIYLDQPVSAAEALTLGLLCGVVPDAGLAEEAVRTAAGLAGLPRDARARMKGLLALAQSAPLDAVLDAETQAQTALLTSAEHARAVDGFLDRPR